MNLQYGLPIAQQEVIKKEEPLADLSTLSVSTRIQDFWTENPRLRFVQVEAILNPQKISDSNKYYMVVSKLSKEAIQQVADILANPPDSNKYETLKNRLLHIYEESETRQVQKLISEIELGDQKPSQLLRRMRELARGKIEDDTLNILWQGHLPWSVRAVLTVTSTKNLEDLAVVADKIMDTYQSVQVSEVARSRKETATAFLQNATAFDVATIMAEIAKINLKINEMDRRRGRSRSTSRRSHRRFPQSRSLSRPRKKPESPDWLCPYHFRYRTRARKCIAPCSWKSKMPTPELEN